MTALRLRFGEVDLLAELDDTPTGTDLLARLPMTARFEDFSAQEKLSTLHSALTTERAPRSSGAHSGDIGYYAPTRALVLYYAEVRPYPGIVPIGRFDVDGLDVVRAIPDGTEITFERS